MLALLVGALSALVAAPHAAAQNQGVELDVRVLLVRGDVVEIDAGSRAGARPGDVVVLRPLGRGEQTGRVQSTRERTSVVVVSGGSEPLTPGVPGILRVTSIRVEPDEGATAEPAPIEWSNTEGPWQEDAPLLAEVKSPLPAERPAEWRGRGTLGAFLLVDDGALPRTDRIGWLGLGLVGENPFGRGGQADVAFEVRANDLAYDDPALVGDTSTFLRLDRLSYAWGGTREEPWRLEGGRFLSRTFPELGYVDGLEASYRTVGGARFGALSGFQPALDAERSFEDSPQIALWAVAPIGADARGDIGLALQKTWFDGQEDRDLVLARGRWTDGPWHVDASVWIDAYGSEDPGKASGLELTEARAGVSRSIGAGSGIRVDATRIRFPSLRRFTNQDLSIERLQDAEADTLNVTAWMPAGANGRWNARAGKWTDGEDDGGWFEVGHARDVEGDAVRRWSIDAFLSNDALNDVLGARARVAGRVWNGTWSLSLDAGQYDRSEEPGVEDEFQSAVRAGWNGEIADRWFLQLDVTQRFGDEQSAYSIDMSLSRSL